MKTTTTNADPTLKSYRITITYADGTSPAVYPSKSRHGVAGAASFAARMRRDAIAKHGGSVAAEPITDADHDAMEAAHRLAMRSGS